MKYIRIDLELRTGEEDLEKNTHTFNAPKQITMLLDKKSKFDIDYIKEQFKRMCEKLEDEFMEEIKEVIIK